MKADFFAKRRKALMKRLGAGAIALVPAAPAVRRNADTQYPYRPDSDFHYLTGFDEPEALAVLLPDDKQPFRLFCRPADPARELWDGPRAGLEGARKRYGADLALPIEALNEALPGMLEGRVRILYAIGSHAKLDELVPRWIAGLRRQGRSGVEVPEQILALEPLLHEMRLIKQPQELELMREAARISVAGHRRMMRRCRPGLFEYQLEAEFVHECQWQGARHQAYPPIVAGGANACTLHYVANDQPLRDGDLVLIDAGAEYQGYAADISRTFPVNGRFSKAQRALYALVLAAQEAALAEVAPGRHWNAPHEAAVEVLTRGLVELGLLKGPASRQLKREGYRKYYMHRTGHWLGRDVHDVGRYKTGDDWRLFEPGMVLTVEPGLYIPARDRKVDKVWCGIGIRIEDDVLVTERGHELLTPGLPRTPDEIEAWMQGS